MFVDLKYFYFILLLLKLWNGVRGQRFEDCSSSEDTVTIFNEPIDLFHQGVIVTYENVSIQTLEAVTNQGLNKLYINARLEPSPTENSATKNLVIYTTEDFKNYAKEQSLVRVPVAIQFGCLTGKSKSLFFFQPFLDKNYFAPEFSKKVYEIVLPTPVFAGFDLASLSDIVAQDFDLVHNQVKFSGSNSNSKELPIEVRTRNASSEEPRTFRVSLILTKLLKEFKREVTFPIMAMDNGIPPKMSSALIRIRPDERSIFRVKPKFERSFYLGRMTRNLTLEPMQVALLPQTFSARLIFTLTGTDHLLFKFKANANVLQLELKQPLNKNFVEEKQWLQFEVQAQVEDSLESDMAVVLIQLPTIEENFHFQQAVYEGFFDDSTQRLQIEEIIFDEFAFNEEIEFRLEGQGSELFQLQTNNNNSSNKILLQPLVSLEQFRPTDMAYLKLKLHAQWKSHKAVAFVLVKLPSPVELKPKSKDLFEKPLYIGSVDDQRTIQMEKIRIMTSTPINKDKLKLSLDGDVSEFFDITVEDQHLSLQLKTNNKSAQFERHSNALLTLNGEMDDVEGRTSILLRNLMPRQASKVQFFDKLWYKGQLERIHGRQMLNFEPIPVREGLDVTKMAFSIKGVESSHFRIVGKSEDNKVHFELQRPIEDEVINEKIDLIFDFHVRDLELQMNNTLVVVIAFPKLGCNETDVQLNSQEYIFSWSPNKVGSLANITSGSSLGSNIRYALVLPNGPLERRLTIDPVSGELKVLSFIPPGIYAFEIILTNVLNSERIPSRAQLNVESMIQCEDRSVKVANALIVKHIEEEKVHDNIFNLTFGNCFFEILSFHPNNKEYVKVNGVNATLSTIAIDREDPVFRNMPVPQIQVKLQLQCPPAARQQSFNLNTNISLEMFNESSLMSMSDIPYSQDLTRLVLIIDDINDNPPVFKHPVDNVFMAYPSSDVSFELFPEHLTRVEATDLDEGLNSHLIYSIQRNEHFDIEPQSGVVYPKAKALEESEAIKLVIQATDKDGAADGLTSLLHINVQRLSAEYFALVTVDSEEKLNIKRTIEQMANELGLAISVLRHATIIRSNKEAAVTSPPQVKARASSPARGEEIREQAWLYAFLNGQPVLATDLIKKIQASAANESMMMLESFMQVGLMSNHSDLAPMKTSMNYSLFIIVICLLSAIVAVLIGFIYWRFYPEYWFCKTLSSQRPHHQPTVTSNNFQLAGGPNAGIQPKCFDPCAQQDDGIEDSDLNDVWCTNNAKKSNKKNNQK